jgi:hypothetical protein
MKIGDKLKHINCNCSNNNKECTIIDFYGPAKKPLVVFIQKNEVNFSTVLPEGTYILINSIPEQYDLFDE